MNVPCPEPNLSRGYGRVTPVPPQVVGAALVTQIALTSPEAAAIAGALIRRRF